MSLFLGFEGLFHLLDVLVETICDNLYTFGRLFLDRLLAGFHPFFVLEGKFVFSSLDNSFLVFLKLGKGLVVDLVFVGSERFLSAQLALEFRDYSGIVRLGDEMCQRPGDESGRRGGNNVRKDDMS